MSAGRSLFRRSAIALAAAGLALATVVAAVHPAELVLSQGQDTEAAQASLSSQWPVGWAGAQAARIYTPKVGRSAGYNSSYRWQTKNYGSNNSSGGTHQVDESLRQSLIKHTALNGNGVTKDPSGYYVAQDGYPRRSTPYNQETLVSQACTFVSPNFQSVPGSGPADCGATVGDVSAATHTLKSFGFQIDERDLAGDSFINAWDVTTGVRCGTSSAAVTALSGRIDVTGIGNLFAGPPKYTNGQTATIWQTTSGTSNSSLSENLDTYEVLGVNEGVRYRPLVRTITQQNPPYALSEVGFYLDTYEGSFSVRNRASKFYFSLSRSECGARNVQLGGQKTPPERAPDMPGLEILTNTAFPTSDSPFSSFQGATTRAAPAPQLARNAAGKNTASDTTEGALGTTTTSPIEDATGVEVTSSAPPADGDGNEDNDGATAGSASSTSAGGGEDRTSDVIPEGGSETTGAAPTTAAPSEVPTVPDEPGPTPANAEFCESLKVDGEYVDAFTADECDAAARISAMRALEDYIADGEQDSRWKGFTSNDPEADGWRWAAIDQRTGQVVYVP